jgi:hypothetical protein
MDTHEVDALKTDLHHDTPCDTVLWSFGTTCLVCNEAVVLFYSAPKTRHRQKPRIVCNRCRQLFVENQIAYRTK